MCSKKKKTAKKPQNKNVADVIERCKQDIAVYPARIALKTKTLEGFSTKATVPPLPKNHSELGKDYDLRRLRDGFIYILAKKSDDDGITARASEEECWYVYRYYSPDVKTKNNANGELELVYKDETDTVKSSDLPMAYHFKQYKCVNHNIYQDWYSDNISEPYIRLSADLTDIDILYSDFELPLALLDKLAKKEINRSDWMQTVDITTQTATDLTFPVSELTQRVQDFNPADRKTTTAVDNSKRFIPIGYNKELDSIVPKIEQTCFSGVVVGLDDNIGTSRDVAAYHQYLEAERQSKLRKYEYAITTAQIIDAYANQQREQYNAESVRRSSNYRKYPVYSDNGRGYSYQTPPRGSIDLLGAYKNIKEIEEQHLNPNGTIIPSLLTEFGIESLPGVNTIQQVANLPGQYGKPFENIIKVQAVLATNAINTARITNLYQMVKVDKSSESASALCLYLHGMLWGINQTPMGRQIVLRALRLVPALIEKEQATADNVAKQQPDPTATKQQSSSSTSEKSTNPPTIEDAAKQLSTVLVSFSKMTAALAGELDASALNVYSFDKIVSVLVTETTLVPLKRKAGKTIEWKETKELKNIRKVYRKKGITEKAYDWQTSTTVKEKTTHHDAHKVSHFERREFYERAPKSTQTHVDIGPGVVTPLVINDDTYKLFETASDKLSGVSSLFALGSLLLFFSENTAETIPGQIANNPALNSALSLAEIFKPANPVTRKICENSGRLLLVESKTGAEFASKGAAVRAGLLNFSMALSAIGIVLEAANMYEAHYSGDDMAFWGAASRGLGFTALALAAPLEISGILGVAFLSASVIAGIGFVFVLVGLIMALLTTTDMQKWIENGFWGNSGKYWGKAIPKFYWSTERKEITKFIEQFKQSKFKLIQSGDDYLIDSNSDEYQYYHIEMQRFFRFSDKPTLTIVNARTLRVAYQGLTNDTIAQQIQLVRLRVRINNDTIIMYSLNQQIAEDNPVEIAFEGAGQATLHLPTQWTGHYTDVLMWDRELKVNRLQSGSRKFTDKEIRYMDAKITIPNNQEAEQTVSAEAFQSL